MSELPRLHTEPESELERSLLDAGRSYTASGSARAKALAGLGIVGVTASTSAASAVTKAGIAKWVAATALIAGAAVPAVRYLRLHAATPPSASAVGANAPITPPAVVDLASAVASAPSTEATPSTPSGSPANAATASAPGASHNETKSSAPAALAAELSALDAARSALASGDANGALSGLDAYSRNFPHGKLSLEAEVLRIDALAKSGQTAAAKKRAEAFMKRHPDSVLASRVRAYAGQ